MELRRLRERTLKTGDEVADELGWSTSKVSRIENARLGISTKDLKALLDVLNVDEEHQSDLLDIGREARKKGWWDGYADSILTEYANYISLEAAAASLRCYDALLINGLLQTADYAREAIRAALMEFAPPSEVDRRVEVRQTRQQRLTNEEPMRFWTVLDESALRRNVGGPAVLCEQYEHLLNLGSLHNVTIQVLPTERGAHPATAGTFALMEFTQHHGSDVVYIETMTSSLYVEDERSVYRYGVAFKQLLSQALSPEESAGFIARLRDETRS